MILILILNQETANVVNPFLSSSSSSDDEDSNNVPLGDTWDQACDFKPTEPNQSIRFADHFTSTAA
jgi:hypothetical protein